MFCCNNVLMFSPMGEKEHTSVYLVGWANAWDWMPFWKDCANPNTILHLLGLRHLTLPDSVFLLHLHCELQKEAYHMNLFPS